MQQYTSRIPHWLATPFSVLSTLAAFAASGLLLLSASYGDWTPAIFGMVGFAVAGVLWYLGDFAAGNRPL